MRCPSVLPPKPGHHLAPAIRPVNVPCYNDITLQNIEMSIRPERRTTLVVKQLKLSNLDVITMSENR